MNAVTNASSESLVDRRNELQRNLAANPLGIVPGREANRPNWLRELESITAELHRRAVIYANRPLDESDYY